MKGGRIFGVALARSLARAETAQDLRHADGYDQRLGRSRSHLRPKPPPSRPWGRRRSRARCVPERPTLDGLEAKWSAAWERDGVYRFDRSAPRERVFSIDTPPPTVSGSLHVGHVFSYTHTDTVARYQRMRGREVFYPMGWDDNGLPTERRVQNHFGVRCDPSVPYDPAFTPAVRSQSSGEGAGGGVAAELRGAVPGADRDRRAGVRGAVAHARAVGGLVDDVHDDRPRSRSASPSARSSGCSRAGRPTSSRRRRCGTSTSRRRSPRPSSRTAIARGRCTGFASPAAGGGADALIETTRPELIPACVALLAHPDDARHRELVGGEALTPLFGTRVPVMTHPQVERDKGTGLVMVCTFGDLTDVMWWRELGLPVRSVLGPDGRLVEVPWGAPGWESQDLERGAHELR